MLSQSQPRIHLARIPALASDPFVDLFASAAAVVRARAMDLSMTLDILWDFAQYLDLADAGYGKTTDALYRVVSERARVYVQANADNVAVLAMARRTCCLSRMLEASLLEDDSVEDLQWHQPAVQAA